MSCIPLRESLGRRLYKWFLGIRVLARLQGATEKFEKPPSLLTKTENQRLDWRTRHLSISLRAIRHILKALTSSFHPIRFAAKALTVIHDCHPATRLSSSTILLHVVFGGPGLLLPSGLPSGLHSNAVTQCSKQDIKTKKTQFLSAKTEKSNKNFPKSAKPKIPMPPSKRYSFMWYCLLCCTRWFQLSSLWTQP